MSHDSIALNYTRTYKALNLNQSIPEHLRWRQMSLDWGQKKFLEHFMYSRSTTYIICSNSEGTWRRFRWVTWNCSNSLGPYSSGNKRNECAIFVIKRWNKLSLSNVPKNKGRFPDGKGYGTRFLGDELQPENKRNEFAFCAQATKLGTNHLQVTYFKNKVVSQMTRVRSPYFFVAKRDAL